MVHFGKHIWKEMALNDSLISTYCIETENYKKNSKSYRIANPILRIKLCCQFELTDRTMPWTVFKVRSWGSCLERPWFNVCVSWIIAGICNTFSSDVHCIIYIIQGLSKRLLRRTVTFSCAPAVSYWSLKKLRQNTAHIVFLLFSPDEQFWLSSEDSFKFLIIFYFVILECPKIVRKSTGKLVWLLENVCLFVWRKL